MYPTLPTNIKVSHVITYLWTTIEQFMWYCLGVGKYTASVVQGDTGFTSKFEFDTDTAWLHVKIDGKPWNTAEGIQFNIGMH